MCNLLGIADVDIFYENLKTKVADRVGSLERVAAIENLGLLSDDPIQKMETPLDTLSHYLSKRLVLGEFNHQQTLGHAQENRNPDGFDRKPII